MPFKKGNVLYKKRTQSVVSSNRITEKEYKTQLEQSNNDHGNRDIVLVGKYLGKAIKTEHRCRKCNHTWEVKPSNLTTNLQGCPVCGSHKSQSTYDIKKKLDVIYKDKIQFKVLKNRVERKTKTEITAKCSGCYHTWEPSIKNLLYKGSGCPKCSRNHVTDSHLYSREYVLDRFNKFHEGVYDYSKSKWDTVHDKITITCPEHGNFTRTVFNHYVGSPCPVCFPNSLSKPHRLIEKLLKSKNVEYVSNTRDVIPRREIDVYLPKQKIGIEINGIYWHSSKFKPNLSEKENMQNAGFHKVYDCGNLVFQWKPKMQ